MTTPHRNLLQQALDAPEPEPVAARCPDCIGSEQPGWKRGVRCATCDGTAMVAAPPAAPADDHATPSGGQEAGPQEDRIEAAYWRFDARHKGYSQWKTAPMSERDAFKAEMRNALEAEKVRAEMRLVARGWRRPDAPAAPASQWMPIETAPKDGSELLLSNGEAVSQGHWLHAEAYTREKRDADGHYIDQDEFDGFDGWIDYTGGMQPEPTHWMPLPAAPDHLHDIAEKVGPPAAPAPAAPVPDGMATNADEVICPNCAHQFRAIPENVQSLLLASGHEPPFTTPPAAPVVPQPAQRTADCLMCGHCAATGERVAKPAVPLTDEQIRSMWKSSEFRGNGGQVDWFCEGIRAAEAHHGITGASK